MNRRRADREPPVLCSPPCAHILISQFGESCNNPPMPSYTDSDIPGAFLSYWRQALDRSPEEAKELMAQFISDLADILLRTEGAKEGKHG